MCKTEDISPYLRRPLRTYEQFLRDIASKTERAAGREASVESGRSPKQADGRGAASEVLMRVQGREGEARR